MKVEGAASEGGLLRVSPAILAALNSKASTFCSGNLPGQLGAVLRVLDRPSAGQQVIPQLVAAAPIFGRARGLTLLEQRGNLRLNGRPGGGEREDLVETLPVVEESARLLG